MKLKNIKYCGTFFKCQRNGMWTWLVPIHWVGKPIEFLFTPKCLISIISVRIKYGPRSSTVQLLWLHKSHLDSHHSCLSNYSNASVTWNWESAWGCHGGNLKNPLNISTWTNVQASFNPSNHIKHTLQCPRALFHIKGQMHCCKVLCLQNIWWILPIFLFERHSFVDSILLRNSLKV